MIITNERVARVGYFMTSYPTRARGIIVIYKQKLLDSDWLRVVHFKRNTSAKRVTLVQITHFWIMIG